MKIGKYEVEVYTDNESVYAYLSREGKLVYYDELPYEKMRQVKAAFVNAARILTAAERRKA